MKECSDRAVGVIDEQGTVVACNDLPCIGEHWTAAAAALVLGETLAERDYAFELERVVRNWPIQMQTIAE